MSATSSPSSRADSASRFALLAWGAISLLGFFASLANAPAPRRAFLLLALLAWCVEFIRRPQVRLLSLAFLPWLGMVLLSAVWSAAPATTVADALQEVVSPIAAGLLAASLAIRLEQRYLRWPFVLLALGALPAVLGACYVHAGFWTMAPMWLVGAYAGRGVASTLGVFLSLSGGALMAINWARQPRAERGLLFLGGGLLLAGLSLGLLGHNRMFWFSLLVGMLPWLVLVGRGSRRWQLGLGGALLILFVAGMVYSSYFAKAQVDSAPEKIVTQISASYVSDPRWLLWRSWLTVAEERPLLGFGYGSRILPLIGATHVSTGSPELDVAAQHHAHNVLFNIVIQTGFVGLLFFLVALFGVWRLVFRGMPPVGDAAVKWRLAAISLLLGGLAKSMTDDFFWGPAGVVMWLLIGIMAGIGWRPKSE